MEDQQTLDKERIEALQRQDALNYCTLCEQLGIPPEDSELYNRGNLEIQLQQKEESDLLNFIEEMQVIRPFLGEARRYPINIFKGTEEKRALLIKYFPKFGPNGKQNIENYSQAKIGELFNKVVETYLFKKPKSS